MHTCSSSTGINVKSSIQATSHLKLIARDAPTKELSWQKVLTSTAALSGNIPWDVNVVRLSLVELVIVFKCLK